MSGVGVVGKIVLAPYAIVMLGYNNLRGWAFVEVVCSCLEMIK